MRSVYNRTWPGIPGFIACLSVGLGVAPARADLQSYLQKAEPAFAWEVRETKQTSAGTVYAIHLVSQTWQGMNWEHQLQLYVPKDTKPTSTMLLMVTGGSGPAREAKLDESRMLLSFEIAKRLRAPYAVLTHIPNQPLYDGKKEDALIAETFVRYLATKDETWPLLFPMTKSVIKAMDALQQFSEKEWKTPLKQFIVTGGSKRGWTSWLTGASGDPRVKAIAPLVIDTLNMRKQLPHQVETLGAPSEMIGDYTNRQLVPIPETPEALRLWSMIDPWTYREKLTMPKLLIHGNNDPYWSTDATNLYWDDLKGDKWILYVPNAGHDLRQKDRTLLDQADYVVNGLAAFARHQMIDNPMPKVQWKHGETEGKPILTVTGDPAPTGGRLWVAEAPTRDFRKAKWVSKPMTASDGKLVGTIEPPAEGYLAFYGEVDYTMEDIKFHLSTQLRVVGKK
jgi:PhoPQ-activated pathogenicity-related protein